MGYLFGTGSFDYLAVSTPEGEEPQPMLRNGRALRRLQQLLILGTMCDVRRGTRVALVHRLGEGTLMWHKIRHLLFDKRQPPGLRLRKFSQTVQARALHAAGGQHRGVRWMVRRRRRRR